MQNIPTITVGNQPNGPGDQLWQTARPARVKLAPTPHALQSSAYLLESYGQRRWGANATADVRVWCAGGRLAVHLCWPAPEPVSSFVAPDAFQDRCALLFPSAEDTPLPVMGAPASPAELWTWRGDGTVERLEARGPGSVRRLPDIHISGAGVWRNGSWSVALAGWRPPGPARFGVAIWRGSARERGGLKSFSPDWMVYAATGKGSD